MDSAPLSLAPIPKSRYVLFAVIAVAGCTADLLSKHWVFQWLGMPVSPEWWIWEGYIGFQTALNPGALFGMGKQAGWLLPYLSIGAAVGIVYWLFAAGAARDRLLTIALAMVTGGILGNLYDRLGMWSDPNHPLVRHTEVRDWILLRYGEYTWPNFNVADMLLVCGAFLLVWHSFRCDGPVGACESEQEQIAGDPQ